VVARCVMGKEWMEGHPERFAERSGYKKWRNARVSSCSSRPPGDLASPVSG